MRKKGIRVCPECGEYRHACFEKQQELCRNCQHAEREKTYCVCCGLVAPYEIHHIIPQSIQFGYISAKSTVPVCLNCHSVLTKKWHTYTAIAAMLGTQDEPRIQAEVAIKQFVGVWSEQHQYENYNGATPCAYTCDTCRKKTGEKNG